MYHVVSMSLPPGPTASRDAEVFFGQEAEVWLAGPSLGRWAGLVNLGEISGRGHSGLN